MIEQKISILVSCHKPFETAQNAVINPIQVGTALKDTAFSDMLHDNDGDNISHKNKRYCELTAQYYAWKNISATYYGFFHYRRYISFAKRKFFAFPFMNPVMKNFTLKTAEKLGLNEENILNTVSGYDAILPKKMCFVAGNYKWYKKSVGHYVRDLDFCFDVIKKDYPEIYPFVKEHKKAHSSYMCNMFLLKKEYFDSYCKFLFDILQKHEDKYDCKEYDTYAYRVSGFLSERLFDVYIRYLKKEKKIKTKTKQWVTFKNVSIK